ncbi:MAG: LysM peptidoglycan-binding domain-containing protein, partial [Simkaniaceae bacterium]|nr:LysM peptidoglycan-binding domain-containing protein [Simkaniaceae bacterium]
VVAASKEKPKQESKKITPSKSTDRFVVVQKGDFLEKIAKKNQVTVDEIIALNQLSNTRLQIGQELRLPSLTPVKTTPVKKQEEEKYYIVKGGDSPWTIAMKNHMQVDELLQLNNMDESKAKRLRPGDRLRIK